MTREERRERNSKIIKREIEPEDNERYLLNLKCGRLANLSKEERIEFAKSGQRALQEKKKEKRNARQILDDVLTLKVDEEILSNADVDPKIIEKFKGYERNISLYELIQLVAIGKAIDGNTKAYELIRDTVGDKPKDSLDITAQSLTDNDRELLESVRQRLEDSNSTA